MTDRTVHPLPSMTDDTPLDLDSFLPEHVAQPVHEAMQRMRAVAIKGQSEKLTAAEMRQYSEDSKQVISVMHNYLQSDECRVKDQSARERLIRQGAELLGGAEHIAELAARREKAGGE